MQTCRGGAGALQPIDFVIFEDGELAVLAHPAGELGLRRLRRVRELVPLALWLVEWPVCLRTEPRFNCLARRLVSVITQSSLCCLSPFGTWLSRRRLIGIDCIEVGPECCRNCCSPPAEERPSHASSILCCSAVVLVATLRHPVPLQGL